MCPGLSKGEARPSLVPLTFPHWWLTSGLPVRAETKPVQTGSSLAGTLFTLGATFNNSQWHLLEYIFQQVSCQSLDEIRPSVWCQSPTLFQFRNAICAGKASPKECFSPEHAAKPGLEICCSRENHNLQPSTSSSTLLLNYRLTKLLQLLPSVFLSVLWEMFQGHWSWNAHRHGYLLQAWVSTEGHQTGSTSTLFCRHYMVFTIDWPKQLITKIWRYIMVWAKLSLSSWPKAILAKYAKADTVLTLD